MSYPAMSHIQYRLIEQSDETTIEFLHRAIGELEPQHCEGVREGWAYQLEQIKKHAEKR